MTSLKAFEPDSVRTFISLGADLHARPLDFAHNKEEKRYNSRFNTLFLYIISRSNRAEGPEKANLIEIALLLLEHNENFILDLDAKGNSVLHILLQQVLMNPAGKHILNMELVNMLLTYPILAELKDKNGQQAIHLAAHIGLSELVHALGTLNPKPNEKDAYGCTPFFHTIFSKASSIDRIQTTKKLLQLNSEALIEILPACFSLSRSFHKNYKNIFWVESTPLPVEDSPRYAYEAKFAEMQTIKPSKLRDQLLTTIRFYNEKRFSNFPTLKFLAAKALRLTARIELIQKKHSTSHLLFSQHAIKQAMKPCADMYRMYKAKVPPLSVIICQNIRKAYRCSEEDISAHIESINMPRYLAPIANLVNNNMMQKPIFRMDDVFVGDWLDFVAEQLSKSENSNDHNESSEIKSCLVWQ